MSSAAVGTNSGGAGPLSLMSCVRESSPLQDYEQEHEKHVASKRRFWNPKKWFKRKNKTSEDAIPVEIPTEVGKDALRSRSTSELSVDEDQTRRRSSSTMHPGLSVSHDSVFHPLNSGSDVELDAAQSSSSLSISQPLGDPKLQTELSERLRLRRRRDGGASEDDEGLPRSPCNSPTTGEHGFLAMLDRTACKDLPTKSHSTCSDGSLLSMGSSSEMDEDSIGLQSRHSSKLSLHEKRTDLEHDWEMGPTVSIPLNHSAAHHKVAVRPKKTYGAPRRRKGQQLSSALPATPEVNEESSIRSVSPESTTKEAITELYSDSMPANKSVLTEKQLKCSSLPPGLAPPTESKLSRSKSNAGSKSDNGLLPLSEKEEKPSLFERIFPRKSGKKKRKEEKNTVKEEIVVSHEIQQKKETKTHIYNIEKTSTEPASHPVVKREDQKPIIAPRTGASYRQRIQPMDIPVTPKEFRDGSGPPSVLMSPEKSFSGTSPIQAELEQVFKQKQISVTSSRLEPAWKDTPPHSPKSPKLLVSPVIASKSETTHRKSPLHTSIFSENKYEVKNEDIRHKIRIAGLSPLQQRVLSLNDEEDDESNTGYKSLTEFSVKKKKPLVKSHSFKSSKRQSEEDCDGSKEEPDERRTSVFKASSLDSFKNLDDPPPQKEVKSVISSTIDTMETETVTSHKRFKNEGNDQSKGFADNFDTADSITISGPSHTAVVNVRTNTEDFCSKSSTESEINEKDGTKTYTHRENQISVTKIQLKHETTQITKSSVTVAKNEIPEFLNKQLNKVDVRPISNIIFSMKSKTPGEDQSRPKTLFNFDIDQENLKQLSQKPCKENIENVEKDIHDSSNSSSPKTPISVGSQQRFKKNEKPSSRKSSVISVTTPDSPNSKEKPTLKNKSMSLDSLKSDHNSEISSSQDSLDKLEGKSERKIPDGVVLRRKSVPKQKNDDEPELMKVFARRSLKIKESDIEQLQEQLSDQKNKDSDKENSDCLSEAVETRQKEIKAKEIIDTKMKESVCESKKSDVARNFIREECDVITKKNPLEQKKEDPEVQLRRPLNNNVFGQRAISLNPTNTNTSELVVKKQSSFTERRRTDQWITNVKNDIEKDRMSEEILTTISSKSDLIEDEFKTETKNFRQRKAEWEKRAQLAQKKTVP